MLNPLGPILFLSVIGLHCLGNSVLADEKSDKYIDDLRKLKFESLKLFGNFKTVTASTTTTEAITRKPTIKLITVKRPTTKSFVLTKKPTIIKNDKNPPSGFGSHIEDDYFADFHRANPLIKNEIKVLAYRPDGSGHNTYTQGPEDPEYQDFEDDETAIDGHESSTDKDYSTTNPPPADPSTTTTQPPTTQKPAMYPSNGNINQINTTE